MFVLTIVYIILLSNTVDIATSEYTTFEKCLVAKEQVFEKYAIYKEQHPYENGTINIFCTEPKKGD